MEICQNKMLNEWKTGLVVPILQSRSRALNAQTTETNNTGWNNFRETKHAIQIMIKTTEEIYENDLDVNILCVDFRNAFGNLKWDKIINDFFFAVCIPSLLDLALFQLFPYVPASSNLLYFPDNS